MLNFVGRALAQTVPTIGLVQTRSLGQLFTQVINWALYLGGFIAVIFLVYGGVSYITAGGDQEKATQARTTIVNAIIGVVIIALALVIVRFASNLATNTTAG